MRALEGERPVSYVAPVADMRFTLRELVGLEDLARLPGCENAAPDLVDAVLEEAGKLAGEVLAPLNVVGDKQRALLENGVVRTPDGFKDAYLRYVEGGWNALPFDPEHGDRKSTRLNSSHSSISYAVFCLKKKKQKNSRGGITVHDMIERMYLTTSRDKFLCNFSCVMRQRVKRALAICTQADLLVLYEPGN